MLSLSIIGHPGGCHATAQQLFAQSPFQVLRCVDLDHEQTLQATLADSGQTLLVYCPPGLALARALELNSEAACDQTLQNWSDKARTLLRHFMLNRERCTLVNELALLHTPSKVLTALTTKTGETMATEATLDSEQTPQPLFEAFGISLAYTDQHSGNLYRDLETVADVGGDVALHQHQASLRKALQELTTETTETQESTGKSQESIRELQEENELLLLQLQQVQEELEHYFCEYQKLSKTGNTASSDQLQTANVPTGFPVDTLFDLRDELILGQNWHEVEHDGCWAGPGTASTLTLPAVGQGRFELTFDIVHALDIHIVKDMQVWFNDESLKLKHKFGRLPFKRFPCQVSTQIDTSGAQQTPWQLRLRFPKTVSPAEKGSDDHRQLTIRLRAVRVRALTMPHQG